MIFGHAEGSILGGETPPSPSYPGQFDSRMHFKGKTAAPHPPPPFLSSPPLNLLLLFRRHFPLKGLLRIKDTWPITMTISKVPTCRRKQTRGSRRGKQNERRLLQVPSAMDRRSILREDHRDRGSCKKIEDIQETGIRVDDQDRLVLKVQGRYLACRQGARRQADEESSKDKES